MHGATLFGIADEYGDVTNAYVGPELLAPNVTIDANRSTTKWRSRIEPITPLPTMSNPNCAVEDLRQSPVQVGTVGLFEGGGRAHCGVYRPEHDCRMRTLALPFCSVCQERIRSSLAPFGGSVWQLRGNTGTNPATDYLGTNDSQPLVVRTNSLERMRISAGGSTGFGTVNPLFRPHVSAPGAFGGENVNGVALPGNVPIVAQSDSTAIGVLNTQGRPAFALNIDANLGTNSAEGCRLSTTVTTAAGTRVSH